ncbi:MAG: DUF4870 domain-containing protein [Lactococcus lactis]|nr:DUF4870 domain-containing protein [Lactococcus lactis]
MHEMTNYSNLREMTRDELLSFLYSYIKASKYVEEHKNAINKQITDNEEVRAQDLDMLDRTYEAFCAKNLTFYERQAKKKLTDKNSYRHKLFMFSRDDIPKTHKALIVGLLLLLVGLMTSSEFLGMVLAGIVMIPFIVIVVGIILLVFPALALIFFPLIAIGSFLFTMVARALKAIFVFGNRLYAKITLRSARRKDIITARRNGITKENSKDVFKYNERKDAINNKYDTLDNKIRVWNREAIHKNTEICQTLKKQIPLNNQKLDYMIYMYNQIEVGANDTWKESVNDLKLQLRHDELKHELKRISSDLTKTNKQLIKMNQGINNKIRGLNQMVKNEHNRLDNRMDGMFDHMLDYGYY